MSHTECDVLIIGSGIGGLTAAIAAKAAGLHAILIEKQSRIGGSSGLSGGILWLPDNPLMHRDGISDSREDALRYLANFVSDDDPASSLRRRSAFVDTIGPLVRLMEEQGVPLVRCSGYSDYYDTLPGGKVEGRAVEAQLFNANRLGAWKGRFVAQSLPLPLRASETAKITQLKVSWPGRLKAAEVGLRVIRDKLTGRSTYSAGAALQGHLLEAALKIGCDIRTDASLIELVSEAGRVTGAEVLVEGQPLSIRTRRGVVVTAGGFSHNSAMRRQYQRPPVTGEWTLANPGDTGDAISMMSELGAAVGWMDESWWVMGMRTDGENVGSPIVPELHKPHIILVDETGQRFVNEAGSYMATGRACLARNSVAKAVPAWAIMDASHRSRYLFGTAMPGRVPKEWLESGIAFEDNTIAGLARKCGIDANGLSSTIARWNEMAAKGVDNDFGKGDSAYNRYYGDSTHRPNPCMGPIANAPFWAVPLLPSDVGTCGGVITDENSRVLQTDGRWIEGLYAAGNSAAPLAGPHYVGPGLSIAVSAVFGMRAIHELAS